MLSKIFDQFIPSTIIRIPLTLVGGLIAITWLTITKKTHWTKTRINSILSGLELVFKGILGNSKKEQKVWAKWLFTTFILVLSFNICSLIPYTFAPTSHLRITFSLSIPIWLRIQILGFILNWKAKLSHLVPNGTPAPLIPFMVLVETIRLTIQPMTLGFRLGANLLAGHLLIFLCSCVVWEALKTRVWGIFSFILLFTLFALEIAVGFIQAGVFFMLSKQYLEEKTT